MAIRSHPKPFEAFRSHHTHLGVAREEHDGLVVARKHRVVKRGRAPLVLDAHVGARLRQAERRPEGGEILAEIAAEGDGGGRLREEIAGEIAGGDRGGRSREEVAGEIAGGDRACSSSLMAIPLSLRAAQCSAVDWSSLRRLTLQLTSRSMATMALWWRRLAQAGVGRSRMGSDGMGRVERSGEGVKKEQHGRFSLCHQKQSGAISGDLGRSRPISGTSRGAVKTSLPHPARRPDSSSRPRR